jgi:hypothetical protein
MVLSVVRAAVVATKWRGKHISVATNSDTAIEEVCFLFVGAEMF